MAFTLTPIAAKDSGGTAIGGGLMAADVAGGGVGPFFMFHGLVDGVAGVNKANITSGNALKVDASATTQPSSVADGSNVTLGALADAVVAAGASGTASAKLRAISRDIGTVATNTSASVPAGTNVIGKTGIDQTTDGTTNAIRLLAETTKVIGTVNVAASQNIGIVPATSGGLSRSRTLIPNNVTAIVVKASAGQLYKIRATNNSATIAYIKLYDAASATAGAGTIIDTIMIPAASAGGAGVADFYSDFGVPHTTGITYCVTTGIADADTTAPAASAYIVTVFYK